MLRNVFAVQGCGCTRFRSSEERSASISCRGANVKLGVDHVRSVDEMVMREQWYMLTCYVGGFIKG